MKIGIALLEDTTAPYDGLRMLLDDRQNPKLKEDLDFELFQILSSNDLAVEPALSKPVTPENSEEILASLRSYKGPLLLLLDIQMYERGPRERDRANISFQIAATRMREGKSRLRKVEAVEMEKTLNDIESGLAMGNLIVDGLEFGLVAVENTGIEPLLIATATTSREGPLFSSCLNSYALQVREKGALCRAIAPTRASMEEMSRSREKIMRDLSEHVAKVAGEFVKLSRSTDPFERVRLHLADQKEHPHDEDLEYVKSGLMVLLSMPKEEFNEKLWPFLEPHALELWKCSGICRTHLGAIAGWFYALMMYRHMDGGRPWEEVFKPDELNNFHSDLHHRISPVLPLGRVPGTGLQKVVDRYLRMCQHLFRNESKKKSEPGPLRKVSLSDERLAFTLGFDAWEDTNQETTGAKTANNLVEKMALWRDTYLERKQAIKESDQKSEEPSHQTAKAMVDWMFSCAMDAPEYSRNNRLLLRKGVWKMQLDKTKELDRGTQVVFRQDVIKQVVPSE